MPNRAEAAALSHRRVRRWTALTDAGLIVAGVVFAALLYHALASTSSRSRPPAREGLRSVASEVLAAPASQAPASRYQARVAAGGEWTGELRAWAADDPVGALAWARSISGSSRVAAIVAVLEGATAQPEQAVRLARELFASEPMLAADGEPALVGALIRANAFGLALDFVQSGPAELRAESLTTLFAAWVRRDPAFAGELATMLGGEGLRGHAFDAVMRSWATVAPTQAIHYALSLPAGETRNVAFAAAVGPWVAQNPAAVADELPTLADPAERDAATCAVVCATDTLNRSTMTALSWAESVGNPSLRLQALRHVLPEWAEQNAAAAWRYVESAPELVPAERENLRALLSAHGRRDPS